MAADQLQDGDFEGVIPEGEYGAGSVIVWDTGTYRNLTTDDAGDQVPVGQGITNGHVTVWLEGRKLRGGYALTKMGGGRKEWLLVKVDDDGADAKKDDVKTAGRDEFTEQKYQSGEQPAEIRLHACLVACH